VVYLGIDGGGSKTAFVLEDESGQTLGRIETGPSNWISAGKDESRRSITDGIQQLKTLPNIVGGGFAGAGRPEGLRFYRECLTGLLPNAQIFVETDAFISYIGAIGLEPGVLLIAGTGSIAIGRRNDGSMVRVGGWGSIFSDEGSGFWIGREAIQAALRANDSGEAPQFVSSICDALKLQAITEVSASWQSGALSVRSVASLAALVFDQHPAEPANRILSKAAEHLLAIAQTTIRRIGIPDCRRSVAGSIGSHPVIRQLMKQMSKQQNAAVEFETPRQPPERGAIMWARSQAQR
jgi:glucosamine kinase